MHSAASQPAPQNRTRRGEEPAPSSSPTTQPACRLDFRIAPTHLVVPAERQKQYKQDLASHGPGQPSPGDAYAWFEAAGDEIRGPLIIGQYQGRRYVLLSNKPADTMLTGPGRPAWGLEDVGLVSAGSGEGTAINIRLDAAGEQRMRRLTATHLRKRLAILVNDQVLTAPVVQTPLGAVLQIAGRFTPEQAEAIVRQLIVCIETAHNEAVKSAESG
jgi:hypothetical protein